MLKGIIPEYSSGKFEGKILYNEQSLSGENFKKNLREILFLFQNPFSQAAFKNVQIFGFDGLKGRALSASYVPSEQDPIFPQMIEDLHVLFEKHQSQGKIEIIYDTKVYFARI